MRRSCAVCCLICVPVCCYDTRICALCVTDSSDEATGGKFKPVVGVWISRKLQLSDYCCAALASSVDMQLKIKLSSLILEVVQ